MISSEHFAIRKIRFNSVTKSAVAGIVGESHTKESEIITPAWINPMADIKGVYKEFNMGFLY